MKNAYKMEMYQLHGIIKHLFLLGKQMNAIELLTMEHLSSILLQLCENKFFPNMEQTQFAMTFIEVSSVDKHKTYHQM